MSVQTAVGMDPRYRATAITRPASPSTLEHPPLEMREETCHIVTTD